ncbi:MAG: MogA/MoaB family molybdenum cofactor biosynthesis protein [Thaumarchaeota archaeon]|nr:MogA/MoaB family molybdenum cofactor biosynthesis protein [Nitrososphaerota archaeon]
MSHPHEKHRAAASKEAKVSIITVSTSRYREQVSKGSTKDESGEKAQQMVQKAGYAVTSTKIVDDDVGMIRLELMKSLYEEKADVVIFTGGTGLSPRDVTIEAINPLFDKELEGFGDVFRKVSHDQIGSPAFLSRATAGSITGKIVFCLPGSPKAVETALNLILPELPHAVYVAKG